jgi:ABC-type tungstate transport system permease subunit
MRAAVSALVAVLFLPTPQGTGRELRVISPGVTYNAGLLDLADAFTRETGTKVTVTSAGM